MKRLAVICLALTACASQPKDETNQMQMSTWDAVRMLIFI